MATTNLDSADLKAVGRGGLIAEDVMNKIWDISKIPLPLTDMIGSESCFNSYKEWTTDALAAPNLTNAFVDGVDLSGNDTVTGARVGNHCQQSIKLVRVSDRASDSKTIGRSNELSYQLMRRQQELKRDVEAIALSNQASVADNGNATAGKSGGLPSWLVTNNKTGYGFGAGGAVGGFNTGTGLTVARTASTAARGLTETFVRNAVSDVYGQGGDPSVMMSTPAVIAAFSSYLFTSSARVATLMSDQGKSKEQATAVGSVNVFVTDFGTLRLVPNRLQQTHAPSSSADVFIIDPAYLSLGYLSGYKTQSLAKNGLAENRAISVDWTLIVNTEKSHAIIGDIDASVAVTL